MMTMDAFERYARRRRRSSVPGRKRKEKEADERRFTWEVRSCSPTGTAAALPRLLRHFVLLSYTRSLAPSLPHTDTHTSSHMRSPSLSVLILPPSAHLSILLSLSLFKPPSFFSPLHFFFCCMSPLLAPGFSSLSQHLTISRSDFWQPRSCSKITAPELLRSLFLSHAHLSPLTCSLIEL